MTSGQPQTAGVVAVGGSASGHLEKQGDVDWFKVLLAAGIYRFEVLGEALERARWGIRS